MMKKSSGLVACLHSRLKFAVIMLLVITLGAGLGSCTSQKKLAKKKAEQELAEKTAKAKADLLSIINDNGKMTLEEKEFKLEAVKRMNLDNQEIRDLIAQAEDKIDAERQAIEKKKEEERLQREKEAREREMKAGGPYRKINDLMDEVASANDISQANLKIRETLMNFAGDEVPVLILISKEGEVEDYDRPTTIRKYLEFIKDQKKSMNKVLKAQYDPNGKITELELIKK